MTKKTSRRLTLGLGLLLVIGLPLLGKWARSASRESCDLDGAPIEHLYRVRVVDDAGQSHEFCCIHCATLWLSHQKAAPQAVFVTDEITGQEIDADSAFFVRSEVVTVPHTGNRIHAFGSRRDAARHAAMALGTVLVWNENPFGSGPKNERAAGTHPMPDSSGK